MKKAKMRTSKVTAVALSALMMASMFSEFSLLSASGEETGGFATIAGDNKPTQDVMIRQADPSTMDDYMSVLDLDSTTDGSRYAGRLWTDKSVFANGFEDQGDRKNNWAKGVFTLDASKDGVSGTIDAKDADFLEVLSALGSSEVVDEPVPLDVVFVIDTSGSMDNMSPSRISHLVPALNNAMKALYNASPDSRVGVAVYNRSAKVFMPLDKYTSTGQDGNFISLTGDGGKDGRYTLSVTATGEKVEKKDLGTYNNNSGTNMQSGIYCGMKMLADEEVTTYQSKLTGQIVNRVPAVIVMTDGGSNCISQGSFSNPKYEDVNSFENERINTFSSAVILQTLMSAAYMKSAVEANYKINDTNEIKDLPVYTIGVDVRNSMEGPPNGTDYWAVARLRAALNPKVYFNDSYLMSDKAKDAYETGNYGSSTAKHYNDYSDKIYEWKDFIALAWNTYKSWCDSKAGTINFDTVKSYGDASGENKNDITNLQFSQLSVSSEDNPYKVTSEQLQSNILYNTSYESVDAEDMSDVFNRLIQTLLENNFTPVAGANDLSAGVDNDSVTFKDTIGKYMEVKDIKNVVLFGTKYEVTNNGGTTYKIAGEGVDNLRLNPAYANMNEYANWDVAKATIEIEGDDKYKNHPGVYKLSDITIEVRNGESSSTDSEQTLWVDVPVNALPLRLASVSVSYEGGKAKFTYSTNIDTAELTVPESYNWSEGEVAAQDLPLRVFYTVGVKNDIKKADGTIDVSKIQYDYLDKYKVTEATKEDRDLKVGDIEFFTNYYDNGKDNYTYPGYGDEEGLGFPYGDTEGSFSPSNENRYYVFQEAIPLYSIKEAETTRITDEVKQNGVTIFDLGNDGILSDDDIKASLFLKGFGGSGLIDKISDIKANRWYFVVVQYFVPEGETGKVKYTAIPRKGSEFGVGNKDGNYLCWYDANPANYGVTETKEYSEEKPESTEKNETWVIAVKKGGLRSGVLARNAKQKSSAAKTVSTYSVGNITRTADYYYLPTIGSEPHDGDTVPAVNVFLGNNGRLVIRNAKTEEDPGEGNLVGVGDNITYKIHWAANPDEDSVVTITDPLDDGVDFVSAEYGTARIDASKLADNQSQLDGSGTVDFEKKAGVPVSISYDKNDHKVTWIIGNETDENKKVPAGASGDVTLVVKVNEKALKTWNYDPDDNSGSTGKGEDFEVLNRAQIQVNDDAYYTNTVDNPTPGKTEEDPGDGEGVVIGEEIDYKIHWQNDRDQESIVTVTDPLDPGVDFVSASYRGVEITANPEKLSNNGGIAYGPDGVETPISITYNPKSHTVTWVIGDNDHKVPVGLNDNVYLKVKVNENAVKKWTYNEGQNSGTLGEGEEDYEVLNRAQVAIDDRATYTNTVENPLESKTETDPGAGKLVGIGDEITYKIHWEADLNQDSFVEIVDPLDKGVDFVSAKYENGDQTVEITTDYYDRTESINFGDESVPVPVHIKYDAGKHAVTWTFGSNTGNADVDKKVPAGTNGEVTLIVKVNENAAQAWSYNGENNTGKDEEGKDYEVRNRARVQVNNSSRFTNEVENPVPDKEEVTPGDGKGVSIGEEITYHVHWEGDRNVASVVTVTDPLDQGVDFKEAGYAAVGISADQPSAKGTVKIGETENIPVSISYDATSHTVTWKIGDEAEKGVKVPAGASGDVTLVVKVNESAKQTWEYKEDVNSGQPGDGNDFEVYNRAQVKVNNDAKFTNTVENPLESKEEVTPGEGLPVGVGKEITYQIHWEADENLDSVIKIFDPLDEGVNFVKASLGSITLSDGTVLTDEDGKIPNSVSYDLAVHTVKWTIGSEEEDGVKVPAGASGSVTLVVRVNANALTTWEYDESENSGAPGAGEDYEVLNRAQIQVNNEPAIFTNVVENPIPEKTEVTPGDGENVKIGEEITYNVHWEGNPKEESCVTVVDPLDNGVDFIAAGYAAVGIRADLPSASGTVKIGETENVPVTISYDQGTHTVTWEIGDKAEKGVKVPAGATGDVTLVVKVNENAIQKWSYQEDNNSGTPGEGIDYEVLNRAWVEVNDHGAYTNTVENPLGPEKSEISPGEGEQVAPGDEITYEITWHNYEEKPADVIITDKLDPGVDFTSAAVYDAQITKDENAKKPTVADLTVSLTMAQDAKPTAQTFDLTLNLTLPELAEGEEPAEEYIWHIENDAGEEVQNGKWTQEQLSSTLPVQLAPGETLTVEDLPVGTLFTLRSPDNPDAIVENAKLGLYGSAVKVKVSPAEAILNDTPQPNPSTSPETSPSLDASQSAEPTETAQPTDTAQPTNPADPTKTAEPTETAQPTETTQPTNTAEPTQTVPPSDTVPPAESTDPADPSPSTGSTETTEPSPSGDATLPSETEEPTAATASPDDAEGSSDSTTPPQDPAIPETPQAGSEDTDAGIPSANATKQTSAHLETVAAATRTSIASVRAVRDRPNALHFAADDVPSDGVLTPPNTTPEGDPAMDPAPTDTEPAPTSTVPTPTGTEPSTPSGDPSDPTSEPSQTPTSDPTQTTTPAPTEQPEDAPATTATPSSLPTDSPMPQPEESEEAAYILSAEVVELPKPEEEAEDPQHETMPITIGDGTGFNKDTRTYDGFEPAIQVEQTSEDGRNVAIYYYAEPHVVVWVLENRNPNEEGVVSLRVTVNEDAEKYWSYDNPGWGPDESSTDKRVRNQAGVKVGDNPEVKTRIVENPTGPDKTETHINDTDVSQDGVEGENGHYLYPEVKVGDTITYEITWQNTEAEPADITIRDPLDPGVDFVSASDGGIYDAATHTVFWNLGKQPAGAVGKVTLTVRVNEKSLEKGEVDNQAFVKVGDNPEQATRIPQNPVEPPETPTPTPPTTPPPTPPIPWWPWWPKNTPTPTPASSGTPVPTLDHELPPRTGDEAPIGLVAALAAIAAIGLAGACTALLVRRKKKSKK